MPLFRRKRRPRNIPDGQPSAAGFETPARPAPDESAPADPSGPSAERDDSLPPEMPASEEREATSASPGESQVVPIAEEDTDEARAFLGPALRGGLADWEIERVQRLTRHAAPDVRRLALRVLASRPGTAWEEIKPGLEDPDDGVRAEAVLAAGEDPGLAADIVPFVGERGWPAAQLAALRRLPGALAGEGVPSERDVTSLLLAVARLPSPPVDRERQGLAAIAAALGTDRLIARLSEAGHSRLGAARMLVVEGSADALRAVAALSGDPSEEIRVAASAASDLLGPDAEPPGTAERGIAASPGPEEGRDGRESPAGQMPWPDTVAERARIRSLAADALSPDPQVRDHAMATLREPGWDAVLTWVRESLLEDDEVDAALAANLAGRLMLGQLAPALLSRALELPPEDRGPYIRALASLDLEAAGLASLVREIGASHAGDAVTLLWEIGGREFLRHLATDLGEVPADVRTAVLETLPSAQDPDGFAVARGLLVDDPSVVVRLAAVRVLASAGSSERIAALARALEDPQARVRRLAVEVLPGRDPAADRHLLAALDDPDDDVASAAIPNLARRMEDDPSTAWAALRRAHGDRRARLEEALTREDTQRLVRLSLERLDSLDVRDRVLATQLAAEGPGDRALLAAVRMLSDPSPAVREVAAGALRGTADARAVRALRTALTDPSPDVRIEVVRALAARDEEATLDGLVGGLSDRDPRVREVLVDVLGRMSSRALGRRLVRALERDDVRPTATELLAGMGRFVEGVLEESLPQEDPDVRHSIGMLLQRVAGLDEFARRLTSTDRDERAGAIRAIAAIGTPEAIQVLTHAVSDPDESIRLEAVRLLAETGDPAALEAVRLTAESDPVAEVAEAAREALRRAVASRPN